MSRDSMIEFLCSEIRKSYKEYSTMDKKSYFYSLYRGEFEKNVYALKIVKQLTYTF